MNSVNSELNDTSSNSSRMFLSSNAVQLPATSVSPTTTYHHQHHHQNKTTNAFDVSNNELQLNNDFNARSTTAANTRTMTSVVAVGAKAHQERYVWEMRSRSPNVTPASTVLNSPDLNTDMQCSLQLNRQHHQIRVGRSPGSQFDQETILPQGLSSPGSPTDVGKAGNQCLHDGEIVVFDDIDTNWMNKVNNMHNNENEFAPISTMDQSQQRSTHPKQNQNQQQPQQKQQQQKHHHRHHHTHHRNNEDDVLKVTKMIGQLPIAEYEGSPRRFGNNHNQTGKQSNTATNSVNNMPKRPPGFPQRVSPKTANPQNERSTTGREQQQQYHQPNRQSHQQQQQQEQQHSASSTVKVCKDNPMDNKKSIGNLIDIDDDDGRDAAFNLLKTKTPTFDYLYEFSETRKVLEEFFKANADDEKRFTDFTESGDDIEGCDFDRESSEEKQFDQAYVGQRLARIPKDELYMVHKSPKKQPVQCDNNTYNEPNDIELYIDSNSRSSCDLADTELEANLRHHSRNFTLSPETTDYDSNCGDLDSLSNDINCTTDYGKLYTSMPILEDGLSSGHASDTENNAAVVGEKQKYENHTHEKGNCFEEKTLDRNSPLIIEPKDFNTPCILQENYRDSCNIKFGHNNCADVGSSPIIEERLITDLIDCNKAANCSQQFTCSDLMNTNNGYGGGTTTHSMTNFNELRNDSNCDAAYTTRGLNINHISPLAPESAPHRQIRTKQYQQQQQQFEQQHEQEHQEEEPISDSADIQEAMKEIRSALQRAKTQPEKLKFCDEVLPPGPDSPIWVLRKSMASKCATTNSAAQKQTGDDEEADTDLETDRLLGQQRIDDQNYFDDKTIWPKTSRLSGDSNDQSPSTSDVTLLTSNSLSLKPQSYSSAIRQGVGTSLTPSPPENCELKITSPEKLRYTKSPTGSIKSLKDTANSDKKAKSRNKEDVLDPAVLIEGVLFRARYLGSTQLVCEGQPTKSTRMMQAEEAVSRIKAPEGESQPSTEVDLFISTEKIMVLNTDLKEIMMDHALRTISYIADIGDLVVLMARRRFVPSEAPNSDLNSSTALTPNAQSETSSNGKDDKEGSSCGGSTKHNNRTPKMICHVFESDEAQFIAQSIGQAFQVAYMEFLKANGIEDHSFVKEMDYQEVLNSQEIFGDELEIFAKKELQKEVVVPKVKGEILGVVIVESGWGSMLPTVVIANLMSTGAAARCGQLNIGDQLIAINGMSLVGLPLSTCQSYIRNAKNQTAVKFTVVPCPPVVEVKIKRPNTKYQLGFSVQNGVICSLLRGGIAERGGVRVGHRIIEINNQSVVAVPHEKIVNLLATSVGEILMKTMPTSMFRLLTGQEYPTYI